MFYPIALRHKSIGVLAGQGLMASTKVLDFDCQIATGHVATQGLMMYFGSKNPKTPLTSMTDKNRAPRFPNLDLQTDQIR
jgi:hypothetical protein